MRKKLVSIGILLLFLLASFCLASEPIYAAGRSHMPRLAHMSSPLHGKMPIPVTSPWGDPNHGSPPHTHQGIDFAADEGQAVYAVADGEVIISSDDPESGFDGWVVIQHAGGWNTWYGDMATWGLHPLGSIRRGEVVGYVGTLGGSHLHFEVRAGDTGGGLGQSLDPALWARYATPWLNPRAASVNGSGIKQEQDLKWDATLDFTGAIKKSIDTIAEACTKAIGLLKDIIFTVISILMTIDLTISMMLFTVSNDKNAQAKTPFWKLLILKCILYLLLFFAITHWTGFLANNTRDYFVGLGSAATGKTLEATKSVLADPFSIVTTGAKIVQPLFLIFNESSGFNLFEAIIDSFWAFCTFILVFFCFVYLAINIAMAYLEFYFMIVFSFANFMFAGWKRTRTWAQNGLNGIFASAIKLMFFAVFANFMLGIVGNLTVDRLVIDQEKDGITVSAHPNGNFHNVEEFAEAIMIVESGGDYNIPSHDGYGFGAYQISYANMPEWYEQTFGDGTWASYNQMPYPEGDPRWVSYGDTLQTYSGDYREAGFVAPDPWSPIIQDKIALHKMSEYYQNYGSWHAVAACWNTGNPDNPATGYWEKVCNASGTIHKQGHKLNMPVAVALSIYILFFCILLEHIGQLIIQQFGGQGFNFTN